MGESLRLMTEVEAVVSTSFCACKYKLLAQKVVISIFSRLNIITELRSDRNLYGYNNYHK
jgi:hypothetical protein